MVTVHSFRTCNSYCKAIKMKIQFGKHFISAPINFGEGREGEVFSS